MDGTLSSQWIVGETSASSSLIDRAQQGTFNGTCGRRVDICTSVEVVGNISIQRHQGTELDRFYQVARGLEKDHRSLNEETEQTQNDHLPPDNLSTTPQTLLGKLTLLIKLLPLNLFEMIYIVAMTTQTRVVRRVNMKK